MDAIDKGVPIRHYENHKQVYHALNKAVAGADSKVYVVYERLRSPSEDIAEVKTYFDSARKWAEDGPEGIEDKGRLRSHSIESVKIASDYMECFDAMWGAASERSVSP